MTKNPVIILLNGPPRVGKDTIGQSLCGMFGQDFHAVARKMSKVLKESTHGYYHLVDESGKPLPFDHYEDLKDIPLPEFDGKSPREAYIHYSEDIMKPSRGPDIFGKLLLKELEQDEVAAKEQGKRLMVILTDSGFVEEILPLSDKYGAHSLLLFRLYRKGTGFAGDSRSYLDVQTVILHDEGGVVMDACDFRNDGYVAETAHGIAGQILGYLEAVDESYN